jgi:DNA-directed RNA polymerase subunit RPC12/RpoP
MAFIFCFLCGQELGLRRDKHKKPYFVCDPCGMQIFVRGRHGVENLTRLINELQKRDFSFREHARVLYEIQAVLTELRGIEEEIEKLDSVFDIPKSAKRAREKKRVRKSLDARIENLLLQLENIAHANIQSA